MPNIGFLYNMMISQRADAPEDPGSTLPPQSGSEPRDSAEVNKRRFKIYSRSPLSKKLKVAPTPRRGRSASSMFQLAHCCFQSKLYTGLAPSAYQASARMPTAPPAPRKLPLADVRAFPRTAHLPLQRAWTQLPSAESAYSPRTGHTVVEYEGEIYLFGGTDHRRRQNDLHRYHPPVPVPVHRTSLTQTPVM